MFFILFRIVLVLSALIISTNLNAIVIDSYRDGDIQYIVTPFAQPATFIEDGLDESSVLNGSRFLEIYGIQNGTGSVLVTVDSSENQGALKYDASNTVPTFGNGLIEGIIVGAGYSDWRTNNEMSLFDLTANSNNQLAIDFIDANITTSFGTNTQLFQVTVASLKDGVLASRFAGQFFVSPSTELTTFYLPFSETESFNDFSQVAFVQIFAFNLGAGTTFTLGEIRAVPEPAYVLIFVAVFAHYMYKRTIRGVKSKGKVV